jgi:hypothetical protein
VKVDVVGDEDTIVTGLLARVLYLQYCKQKGFRATAAPYVPAWALDYARVSLDMLGYDDEAVTALRAAVKA